MVAGKVTINGQSASITDVPLHTTALDFLRGCGLTGCKEGCAEGECGACSVLIARPGLSTSTEWVAINACLVPIASLDGQEIVTAEGLGEPGELHPVQQEMAVRGGSQCGYCTPGFICSMAAEYYRPDRRPSNGSDAEADHGHGPNGFDIHALSGNLCRCTGYRPIRDAAYALGAPPPDDSFVTRLSAPPTGPAATRLRHEGRSFVRPETLADALRLLHDDPGATVIAGCTDWGVEVNLRGTRAASVIAVDRLPELRSLVVDAGRIEIGAALTLTEIERRLDGGVPLLAQMFPQFASRLIRNGATLGGNLGTGSPIGDSPPVLLALEASLVLASVDGEREVALSDYFTGYRQSVRRADELIKAVRIPLPLARLAAFHKIAKRRFDDISSVAVAFAMSFDGEDVADILIGLGGVAATPLRAYEVEDALRGRPWTLEVVTEAADLLSRAGTPMSDHRASADYRSARLRTSLLKFFAENPAPALQEA